MSGLQKLQFYSEGDPGGSQALILVHDPIYKRSQFSEMSMCHLTDTSVYKCTRQMAPEYLSEIVIPYKSIRELRSASDFPLDPIQIDS